MSSSETQSLQTRSSGDMEALARALCKNELVPDAFKQKPGNVFAALQLSQELGIGPMTLMRGVYFIKGRPSFDAQLAVALLRRSGRTVGPVRFEEDDAVGGQCRAVVRDRELSEDVQGPWVSMDMAKADGWTKNPKYQTMPQNMLRKRAAIFLIRECYPEVLGGYHTRDEVEDVDAAKGLGPRDVDAEDAARPLDELNAAAFPEPEEPAESEDEGAGILF